MDVGGTQTEVLILCKQLKSLGHGLVIASNGGRLIREIEDLGISHYALPFNTGRKGRTVIGLFTMPYCLFRLVRIIRKERVDLVHVHAYLVPIVLGLLVSRIWKIPLVVTLNDGILYHPFKVRVLTSSGLTRTVGRMIVLTDELRRLISSGRADEEATRKCVVIPNSIDPDAYPVEMDRPDEATAEPPGTARRVVWVGRLETDKVGAIKALVCSAPAILEKVPEAQLLIVGQGSRSDEVEQLITSTNHAIGKKAIIATGFSTDVVSTLKQAYVVAGMGKVVIEAMACGKPVVIIGPVIGSSAPSFGGILTLDNAKALCEYNYTGRNGTVEATPERISEACVQLLKDEKYARGLGCLGRQIVEAEHNIKILAKQVEDVYRDVIERKPNS